MKKRRQFIGAAQSGVKISKPGFFLQYKITQTPLQVGYTASKKVGNAVARNTAKRRLRELVRLRVPEISSGGITKGILVCVATESLNRLSWVEAETSFTEALVRLQARIQQVENMSDKKENRFFERRNEGR